MRTSLFPGTSSLGEGTAHKTSEEDHVMFTISHGCDINAMSTISNKVAFATYGNGQFNNGSPACMGVVEQTYNVTSLAQEIWTNFPKPGSVTIDPQMFSIYGPDPAPGVLKYFCVFYADGTPADCVAEGGTWYFDPISMAVPPPVTCTQPSSGLKAWWGQPRGLSSDAISRMVDITHIAVNHATMGELSFSPRQFFFTPQGVVDPAPGIVKALLVWWPSCLPQGIGCSGAVPEGGFFILPAGLVTQ